MVGKQARVRSAAQLASQQALSRLPPFPPSPSPSPTIFSYSPSDR